MRKKYTREQLIFFMKKLAKRLRSPPRAADMDKDKKMPSSSTYMKRFGSWNSALETAGLQANYRHGYIKKELISSLVQLSKELGRTPKTKDLKGRKWIASASTFRKYFGSWKKALSKAGLAKVTSSLKTFVKGKKK